MKRTFSYILVLLSILSLVYSCRKDRLSPADNGYSSGEYQDTVNVNIDTNRFKIDYSKYTQARLFPGLMGTDEPRLDNYLVRVDLNYEEIRASDLRISVAPGAWQGTGVYAPAGELIVVDVPEGIYGLTAQISPHVATSLDGIDFPARDAVVFTQTTLFPGRNYMRNLYGGLIYIIPVRPIGRIVDLRFSGVAKAPSFKLSGPGATTNEQWKALIAQSTVPWFDLEGDRIVFTMQTEKLKKYPIDDPTELMKTWDKAIREGYWDWTGMTEGNADIRHRAPFNKWRIVHDVLFKPGVAQVSGYPVRATANENYFKQAVSVEGVKNANWGTFHEIGHNMQMGSTWSFAGNGEVTNNLFHFKVSKVFEHQSYKIAEVWNSAVPYITAKKTVEMGKDNINWASMDVEGNIYKSRAHDIRLMMYAQIFEKYGYEFMTYIYKRGREARFTSANNQSKIDFFYEALCEYTEMDMEPYLNKWGLYVSEVSKRYVSEEKEFPLLDRAVWLFNPVTKTGGDEMAYEPLSKTGWVAKVNSADEKRPSANLIDGDINSIWHPCTGSCELGTIVRPATGPFTWTIDIDTKKMNIAKGFTLVQRAGTGNEQNNHSKFVTLEVSDDGTNFRTLGRYPLAYGTEAKGKEQYILFNSNSRTETFRYARFSVQRSDLVGNVNSENAVYAELGLFN
ncbi:M60 family metallopeptidase [Sphingobacterium sp.]|uniref:M60 family metallopeptidase n=1 Tax=Sphingobacterium sp. TaxID=341027 RepID=UPI00289D42B9|nr:M60 family metallopeptidase [Sphingobacterium sp.]